MSSLSARKDFTNLGKTVSQGLCCCLFIAIPATCGLAAIGAPLISVAFQHGQFSAKDTILVAWTLFFYALGLCGYFAQQVLIRAFYSMQDSIMPMRTALLAVCANIVLNLTLIWVWGTGGLAASTALCSYLQVVLLVVVLRRSLRKQGADGSILDGLLLTLVKTLTATLCMSVTIAATLWLSKNWPDIFKLLLVVPSAAGVYLLAAKLLHIEMLSLLTRGKQKPTIQ